MSKEILEHSLNINRRKFLSRLSIGLGSAALGSLLIPDLFSSSEEAETSLITGLPNFAPKAKRVIYLFQNGAPSQLESFDYKPMLTEMLGKDLPESVRQGQRLTGMTSKQKTFPLVGSFTKFNQYGKNGAWVSDLFPHTSKIVDDLCIIRSMHTEAINHDPALKAVYFTKGFKPDSVVLVTNEKENKGKDKLLFDEDIGDMNPGSKKWLRFKERGTYYLYFKEPVAVQQVILNAFVGMEAYIFHPAKIEVWGGMDKSKLRLLKTLQKASPKKTDEEGMIQPKLDFASTKVKYIKLVIHPVSTIPAWHPKLNPPKAHVSEVFLY